MSTLPKAPGFSVFYTDPGEARWIVKGPENRHHLFGHAKNLEEGGFLLRDAEEARAMVRRASGLTLERFGDLDTFNPSELEIQTMDLLDRPYIWLWLRADQLKVDPAEIPAAPCRRELFHFVRDKEAFLASKRADTANLQAQVDKLQEQIAAILQAQGAVNQTPPLPQIPPGAPVPPPAQPVPGNIL